jgi:hypothetical protein
VVETLQALMDSRGQLNFEMSFRVGDRVRLTAGSLAEQLGICDRLADSGRVRVLLDIRGDRFRFRSREPVSCGGHFALGGVRGHLGLAKMFSTNKHYLRHKVFRIPKIAYRSLLRITLE